MLPTGRLTRLSPAIEVSRWRVHPHVDGAALVDGRRRPAEAPSPAPATVTATYLGKAYDEPPPLSMMQKVFPDEGLEGARLAIRDDNQTGRFLNLKFVANEDIVPASGDVVAKAKQILANGPAIIIADLKAPDLLAAS